MYLLNRSELARKPLLRMSPAHITNDLIALTAAYLRPIDPVVCLFVPSLPTELSDLHWCDAVTCISIRDGVDLTLDHLERFLSGAEHGKLVTEHCALAEGWVPPPSSEQLRNVLQHLSMRFGPRLAHLAARARSRAAMTPLQRLRREDQKALRHTGVDMSTVYVEILLDQVHMPTECKCVFNYPHHFT
jgi:hypothetical protein